MFSTKRVLAFSLAVTAGILTVYAPGHEPPSSKSAAPPAAGRAAKKDASSDTEVGGVLLQSGPRRGARRTAPPTKPGALAARLKGGRVELRWTASRDDRRVVEYRVARDGVFVGRTRSTSFVDVPPTGGRHVYTVRAVDGDGNVSAAAKTIVALPGKSGPAYVGWDMFCDYSHSANDDPIVKPAQPGASHLHDFFGNRSVNAMSSYSSMVVAGTTCSLADDTAGYWTPSLYVDGRHVQPGEGKSLTSGRSLDFKVRYFATKASSGGITYTRIPKDLRMVVGVGSAKTPAENPTLGTRMWWGCTEAEDRAIFPRGRTTAPRHCSSGVVSLVIKFQDCWDGVHIDSPDHKSHVANSNNNNVCPASHPKHLPPLTFHIEYFVGTNWKTIELTSGGTSSVHADFWNTWNQSTLDRMFNQCFLTKIWCGTFR